MAAFPLQNYDFDSSYKDVFDTIIFMPMHDGSPRGVLLNDKVPKDFNIRFSFISTTEKELLVGFVKDNISDFFSFIWKDLAVYDCKFYNDPLDIDRVAGNTWKCDVKFEGVEQ